MSEKPLSLAVVSITKNEAYIISDALLACQGLFDEVFVLDTGSTDGTQAILDAAGVPWAQGTWGDDFSKARNAAIAHAKSDWVLMLDADEIVTARTVGSIRNFLKTADKSAYWLLQCNSMWRLFDVGQWLGSPLV